MIQDSNVTIIAERLSDFKIAKAIQRPFLRPTVDTSELEIFYLMDLYKNYHLKMSSIYILLEPKALLADLLNSWKLILRLLRVVLRNGLSQAVQSTTMALWRSISPTSPVNVGRRAEDGIFSSPCSLSTSFYQVRVSLTEETYNDHLRLKPLWN